MSAEVVHILPSGKTPEVILDPKGRIRITGRAIDESKTKFSEQLMTWLDNYILNPPAATEVTIALEYLNSFNAIFLASVLKKVALENRQIRNLKIRWYIEEDDDDLLERANYISSAFSIPIDVIMTDHIKAML